jgi:hypothetical protein
MSLFSDIPTRENGQTIEASWYNTIKTKLTTAFGDAIGDEVLWKSISTTQGTMPAPIMSEIQRDAITVGAGSESLFIWNDDTSAVNVYDGTSWVELGDAADLATHIADTSTHGTTSAIVGVDDVQTLTNKTLNDCTLGGTTTIVNSTNLDVADANITVNDGGNDATAEDAGLTIERTGTDGKLLYEDALASKFKAGASGSEIELANVSSTQTFTNKTLTSPNIDTPTIDVMTLEEQSSTPSTPAPGAMKLYAKDDKTMYQLDSDGTESLIAGGGGAGSPSIYKILNAEDQDSTGWTDSGGGETLSFYNLVPLSGDYTYLLEYGAVNEYHRTAPAETDVRQIGVHLTHSCKFIGQLSGAGNEVTCRVIDNLGTVLSPDLIIDSTDYGSYEILFTMQNAFSNTTVMLEVECTTYNAGIKFYIDDIVFDDDPFSAKDVSIRESYYADTIVGYGSTNTKIPYFSNVRTNTISGTGVIENDSVSGWSFTARKDCNVTISADATYSPINGQLGFSVNSTELTTDLALIAVADRLTFINDNGASESTAVTATVGLEAGDVLRIHTNGAATALAARHTVLLTATADANHVARQEERQQAHVVASVSLAGNDGRAITAGTESIPFSGSGTGWTSGADGSTPTNGNYYTVQDDNSIVEIEASLSFTTTAVRNLKLYLNGAEWKRIGSNDSSSNSLVSGSYKTKAGELSAGDKIAVVSDAGSLANSTLHHYLTINEHYVPPLDEANVITTVLLPQGEENHFSVIIDQTSGTPIVQSKSADFIESIDDDGTGQYTINYKTGFFGAEPSVVGSQESLGVTQIYLASSSSVSVITRNGVSGSIDTVSKIELSRQGSDVRGKSVYVGSVPRNQVMQVYHTAQTVASVASGYVTLPVTGLRGEKFGSVSSDQVTLPSGRYTFEGAVNIYKTDGATLNIHNGTSYIATGTFASSSVADNTPNNARLQTEPITFSVPTTIEFRGYAQQANANGFGASSWLNDGMQIKITKLND